MNRHCGRNIGCKSQRQFYLRFQQRLLGLLDRGYTVAEGFGPAWEKTLDELPLEDGEQPQVYWDLIRWAKSDELFTEQEPVGLEARGP